jgi:hypothetical protein
LFVYCIIFVCGLLIVLFRKMSSSCGLFSISLWANKGFSNNFYHLTVMMLDPTQPMMFVWDII